MNSSRSVPFILRSVERSLASIFTPQAPRAAGLSTAALCGLFVALAAFGGTREAAAQSGYTSPFSITLDGDIASWTTDFATRQATITANATPAGPAWYSGTTSYASLPYGPLNPQLYSTSTSSDAITNAAALQDRGQPVFDVPLNTAPAGVPTATWHHQRLLAAANALLTAPGGTPYQHLHLPNFDPAQLPSGSGYTWIQTSTSTVLQSSQQLADNNQFSTIPNPYLEAYGKPTPGIDCTDFSAYVYNLALGVQMYSSVGAQVQFNTPSGNPAPGATASATVLDTTGRPLEPHFLYGPNFGTSVLNTGSAALAPLISLFQPWDLLYMGDPTYGVLHVVMWLGQTGTSSNGTTFPLVISSHDNTPAIFDTLDLTSDGYPTDGDIAGHLPPPGVHILPFDDSNWFYQDFQLAMRIVPVPEPSSLALLNLGLGLGGLITRGVCGARRTGRRRRLPAGDRRMAPGRSPRSRRCPS